MLVKFIASGNVVFDKSESLPNPCNKKAYQCNVVLCEGGEEVLWVIGPGLLMSLRLEEDCL